MERKIAKILTIIIAVALSHGYINAQDDFDALLDGVLASMGESQAPQKPAAAKSRTGSQKQASKGVDFDAMLGAMGGNPAPQMASAKRGASIDGTLAYLDRVYSAPLPSYYGVDGGGVSSKYAYLVPGSAVLPITGRLTSGFGYRPKFGRMHKGTDIALNVGDTVVAAIDGTVTRVSNDPNGYGLWVELRHENGLSTRYAHLCRQLVTVGARVYAGQPVGLGGSTGNSTGPHLHFETRVNGEAVDPTTMFDFTMPAGRNPYRTLAQLDAENPRFANNTATAALSASVADGTAKSTYVVRLGDTVKSVARKHGISELTLCRLNMLSTNEPLTPGRMLKLR